MISVDSNINTQWVQSYAQAQQSAYTMRWAPVTGMKLHKTAYSLHSVANNGGNLTQKLNGTSSITHGLSGINAHGSNVSFNGSHGYNQRVVKANYPHYFPLSKTLLKSYRIRK